MSFRLINMCRDISGPPSNNAKIIETLSNLFKKYGSTPSVVSAKLVNAPADSSIVQHLYHYIEIVQRHINFDSLEKKEKTLVYSFETDYGVSFRRDQFFHLPDDVKDVNSSELLRVGSDDGKVTAIIRENVKDGKSSQVVEIWSKSDLFKTLNGEKEKSFGKIHLSDTFGSVAWSQDGHQLMFIAEKFRTVSGYFDEKKKSEDKNVIGGKESEDKDNKPAGQCDEYLLKEDWGEQLEGTCHPIIVIVDLNDDYKLRIIDLPEVSCSESFWIDNKTIGFVGIKETSRRLGLIYCPIRGSCLYKCDLRDPESEADPMLGEDFNMAIRSPRVSNDGKKIVFLSNPVGGPHFQASELKVLNVQDSQVKTLINVNNLLGNEAESPTEIRTFYSLYLPKRCWTPDDKKILVNPEFDYRNHLFLIDVDSGQQQPLLVPYGKTVSILDFRDNLIVLAFAQPNLGSNLHIAKLQNNQLVKLTSVDSELRVKREDLDFKCETLSFDGPAGIKQSISCVLVGLKESFGQPTPTILIPHGGPHSCVMASYTQRVAIMSEVGFKVLLVNYRGSTGINSAHERFLCGKVGQADVEDCMRALKHFIDAKEVDPKQVCLYGGSHGGFLVTHLVGQYSDFGFRACCALNPVTDLAAGFSTSDIPDWHLVEGLGQLEPYPLTTVPTPEILRDLLLKSPIYHIDKVKTPVLMVLGTKDKRVPMCEGLAYYYGLKARGVTTKCLVYEDDHNIGKTKFDLDVEMNCLLWCLDHLPR